MTSTIYLCRDLYNFERCLSAFSVTGLTVVATEDEDAVDADAVVVAVDEDDDDDDFALP